MIWGYVGLLDSKALTKIQSMVLVFIIIVAAVGGAIAYFFWIMPEATTVKIGVLADLGASNGRGVWQGVVLAAEQLNAKGGILGRKIEVVGEDTDTSAGVNAEKINNALNRLLALHRVDFIIGIPAAEAVYMVQDIIAQHKKVLFDVASTPDEFTQRVLDNYDSYKYYFRVMFNATSIFQGITDSLLLLREQTGFNKVGYIGEDLSWTKGIMEGLDYVLPELYGFDVVYKGAFPLGTFDFASYFSIAEAAGVEIMVPLIALDGAIPFVKQYHDRQSPMVIYGGILGAGVSGPEGWEITDGECEYISGASYPVMAGYPLTSRTLPDREAYINRWNETPGGSGCAAYDILRYILPDAVRRAGTLEVDVVIEALETTSIEISNARNFVFTPSHDMMMGENPNNPDADYWLVIVFQWIDGELIPVYPKKIMEEAGATYTFPDWPGPWD